MQPPECVITYNTPATSRPRVPSSKLSGIIARSTQWRRYYSIIVLLWAAGQDDVIIIYQHFIIVMQ